MKTTYIQFQQTKTGVRAYRCSIRAGRKFLMAFDEAKFLLSTGQAEEVKDWSGPGGRRVEK